MNAWANSRRTLALQDAAGYLGSTIQQLYLSLNHPTIPSNTIISNSPRLSPLIEDHYYEGNATLRSSLVPALNSSKILDITLVLAKLGTKVTTSVVLGSNALWQNSTFISNSGSACVTAQKANGTILLRFG
jgi:hypothetical protein